MDWLHNITDSENCACLKSCPQAMVVPSMYHCLGHDSDILAQLMHRFTLNSSLQSPHPSTLLVTPLNIPTPVKRFSSWVNTAILLHWKWSSMEWSAGANSSKVRLFLKYRLNLFLSLSAVDPEANEICKSKVYKFMPLIITEVWIVDGIIELHVCM